MKLIRLFLVAIAITVLLAVVTGCASPRKSATARVTIACGTNVVEITQPKDTTIKRLEWDPRGGKLVMEEYSSAANAAVVAGETAKAQSQAIMFGQTVDLFGKLAVTAGRLNGIPVGDIQPGLVQGTPSTVWRIPEAPAGMKWTLGTNGVPKLVPTDNPSTPQPEIPTN